MGPKRFFGLGGASNAMNRRLLVAETDVRLLEIYECYFRRVGYEVDTATGLAECLAKLDRCDLLILELELEDAPGREFLSCFTERAPSGCGGGIPIVLISTAERPSELAVPPDACLVAFLQKPFPLVSLRRWVEVGLSAIDREHRIDTAAPLVARDVPSVTPAVETGVRRESRCPVPDLLS